MKAKKKVEKKVEQIKNQLSIKKFLHAQFIKIGFVVGGIMALMGAFAIYEGVQLAGYKAGEYKTSQGTQIALTVVLIAVVVLISILLIDKMLNLVAKKTIQRISDPVEVMDEAMGRLANGDLDERITYESSDEFSGIVQNTRKAMVELKKYIGNISDTLQQMSERNMDIDIQQEYVGDFVQIRESLLDIIGSMNQTLSEMKSSFAQVRDGAGSLADTAQAMADGAEQQSVHIRGLLDHIEQISSSVHENTVEAEGVEELAESSMEQMSEGEKKMEELTSAMGEIREGSNEIASIIEVITGIAAQTNLLALNASIEAARAGEHGKGFAVVASEIGALAGSSAEASQNITELIQKSIATVNNGVTITDETVKMLSGISEISSQISQKISMITDASKKQDAYLKNMLDDANEIAAVIDENTAAAQESSALSEELLGYTENVMEMIEKYKLREK